MSHITENKDPSREPSKAVLALRKYLQETDPEQLREDWARVKEMKLGGPTLTEILTQTQAFNQSVTDAASKQDGVEDKKSSLRCQRRTRFATFGAALEEAQRYKQHQAVPYNCCVCNEFHVFFP